MIGGACNPSPRDVRDVKQPIDAAQVNEKTVIGDILDNALKSVNSDYEAKRFKDLNLVKPVARSVPKGTFNKWLKAKNKLGGQNKVPRLSNSREYIEDLYIFADINNT